MNELVDKYLITYLTKKVLDTAFIGIKSAVKRINYNKEVISYKKIDKNDYIEFIGNNIEESLNWASNISFQGSLVKSLNKIFIDINLNVFPKRELVNSSHIIDSISINQLLEHSDRNIVLLGDPGAGKTTSIKKIFHEVLNKQDEFYETFYVPIIIRLKDLNTNDNNLNLVLFNEILSRFGVYITIPDKDKDVDYAKIITNIFKDFVERLNVLIILDGYDEIVSEYLRQKVVNNLNYISNSLINSRFILTSRSADFNVNIDNTVVYELSPLSEEQIVEFVNKWLDDDLKSKDLLSKLKKTPYWDTLLRPLLLAQMCALYEKNGDIPDKPKSVYDKILTLLLEEWSVQNSVKRVSKYGNFGVERKKEFISTFAYYLVVFHRQYWFTNVILREIYNTISSDFDLPQNSGQKVINEIESHNGLIVQSGFDKYEFSHKSLAEFLVANYLIKMPKQIGDKRIILNLPNEIALEIAISSGPSFTYYSFVHDILNESILDKSFLKVFLYRLKVENPDFESINPLFALTNIFLLNLISKELYIQYEPVKLVLEEHRKYYKDCILIILQLSKHKQFINSFETLKKYYKIDKVSPSDLRKYEMDFENWNDIYSLHKIAEFEYLGNQINLPEKLYLPESLYSSSVKKKKRKKHDGTTRGHKT